DFAVSGRPIRWSAHGRPHEVQPWPAKEIRPVERGLDDRILLARNHAHDPEKYPAAQAVSVIKHAQPHGQFSRSARRPASRRRWAAPSAAAIVSSKTASSE